VFCQVTYTFDKNVQVVVRNDMDVNEHERLLLLFYISVTVGSSAMRITHTLKWACETAPNLHIVFLYITIEDNTTSKTFFTLIQMKYKNWNGLILIGLWWLTPLSTTFHLYREGQFYWWRKPQYPEKTVDLSQVTDKLSHSVVSSTPCMSGVRTHNFSGDMHWLYR